MRGWHHGWTAVVEGVDGWWRCMVLLFRIFIVIVVMIIIVSVVGRLIVMMLVHVRGEGR